MVLDGTLSGEPTLPAYSEFSGAIDEFLWMLWKLPLAKVPSGEGGAGNADYRAPVKRGEAGFLGFVTMVESRLFAGASLRHTRPRDRGRSGSPDTGSSGSLRLARRFDHDKPVPNPHSWLRLRSS
jgi:hypothetical protein